MLHDENIKPVAEFHELHRRHPHLSTKAMVDLINGIDVVRDHLRVAEKTNAKFSRRFLAAITGETQARMTRVSAILLEGQEATTDWLKDIEAGLAKNRLATTIVANNLHALKRRLDRSDNATSELRETLRVATTRFEQKIEALEGRMLLSEQRDAAELQRDVIFARWSNANCFNYPPIAVSLSIASDLWWGELGSYVRAETSAKQRSDFLEITLLRMAELVALAGDTTTKRLFPRDAVLAPLEKVSVLEREAMQLLALPNIVTHTPLLNLIANQTQSVEALPILFSASGLTNRVWLELRRATEFV